MNQQQQVIQRLHTRASQIHLHLDKQLLKLQQVSSQSSPANQDYQNYYHYAEVPNRRNQTSPKNNSQYKSNSKQPNNAQIYNLQNQLLSEQELKLTKIQIEKIVREYERELYDKQDISYRYNILRQSRKQLYEEVANLKKQLQKNKKIISQHKKKGKILVKLQNQYKLQVVSVNKIQLALNSALKLQYEMEEKINQLDNRQHVIMGKIQQQKQQEMTTSTYWKYYEKWTKLMEHKNNLCKHVQFYYGQNNKQYVQKMEQRQKLQQKLKKLQQVYNQLNVSTNQHQFIIKEIMQRQKISGYQLYNQTKDEHQNMFGQDELEMSENKIRKQLSSFKNQIGLTKAKPQIIKKLNTQPVFDANQSKKVKFRHQTQHQMRLTAKIPQSQLRNRQKGSLSQHQKTNMGQKRHSIQYTKSMRQIQDSQKTSLPKIKTSQTFQQTLSKRNSVVPVTHIDTTNIKSSRLKRGSFDCGQPSYKNNYESLGKFDPGQNQKFEELRKNVRYRTKNGYKYYNYDPNLNNRALGKQLIRRSQTDEKQQDKYSQPQDKDRQRQDIVKVYNRLATRKTFQKSDCDCSQSIVSVEFEQQKQEVQSQPGCIRLKLPNERKKGKSSSKQQLQSRQSDAQGEDSRSVSIYSLQTQKNTSRQPKNGSVGSLSSQKQLKVQQQPQYQRKRLKTIHEKEQQTNLGNSTRNN